MECCYVLTVWVDILVSFYSARRSLGARDSNRFIEYPEFFSLVCGVADCPTNLSWCWDKMGQFPWKCESRFTGKLTVHHGFQNIGAASVIHRL